jgi:hypothetical protein
MAESLPVLSYGPVAFVYHRAISRVAALMIVPGSAVPPVRRQAGRGACTPSVHSAVPPRQRVRATRSAQDVRLVSRAVFATPTNGCDACKHSVCGRCCRSHYQMQCIQWLLMVPVSARDSCGEAQILWAKACPPVAFLFKTGSCTELRMRCASTCRRRCRRRSFLAGRWAALVAVEASSAHGISGVWSPQALFQVQFQIRLPIFVGTS